MSQPQTLPIDPSAPIGIGCADGLASPRRIQLSRKKGWKLPPNTVVVSRPSKWGNPHSIGWCPLCGRTHDRQEAVEIHRLEVMANRDAENFQSAISPLRGKNLACWCAANQECHADILLRLANAESSGASDASAATVGSHPNRKTK